MRAPVARPRLAQPPPIHLGNQRLVLPVLSGGVGPAAVAARYPGFNAPANVALVDQCLAAIAALQSNTPAATNGVTTLANAGVQHPLALANAVRNWRTDRDGAVTAFQSEVGITDVSDLRDGVITPNGETWRTLFIYGSMASGLEGLRDRLKNQQDYIYKGAFDLTKFAAELTTRLQAARSLASRYNAMSIPDAQRLLSLMAADQHIIDIRWMAYMLATVFWETASPTLVEHTVMRHGKAVVQQTHPWLMTMRPVDEVGQGAGRNYFLPVKVTKLTDGTAHIVEEDGDAFTINLQGAHAAASKGAKPGALPTTAATKAYVDDPGTALKYFGRGYVQLTWWYNYATSGVAIGKGLDLLFEPELAKVPETAYALMAFGMRTGRGFANGHQLQHYFYGDYKDYTGARAMVNIRDPHPEIATAAELFEAALLASKPQ